MLCYLVSGFPKLLLLISINGDDKDETCTVKSAYWEPAFKELPVIKNWFSFPNLYKGTNYQ